MALALEGRVSAIGSTHEPDALELPAGERICVVHSLGLMPYQAAWNLQRELVERRKAREIEDTVLFLEHPPVITLGRNARAEHLLTPAQTLRQLGIDLVESDRGGDVTFHGPGQLVGYPILDLSLIRKDVVWYVRTLEEALIRTAREYGLPAERRSGLTGVWVNQAKLAAIGVHLSRWVTSHGFALNLETDLRFFRHIVPCGIAGAPVTSLRECLGRPVDRRSVEQSLTRHLGELLGLAMREDKTVSPERSAPCQPTC
ncbi:MAG: lipoyl(octanoyl) transferase LipB [Terriglobia bacterium]